MSKPDPAGCILTRQDLGPETALEFGYGNFLTLPHDHMATVVALFRAKLEAGWDALVRTGRPDFTFPHSHWIFARLGRIYPTRPLESPRRGGRAGRKAPPLREGGGRAA